MIVMGICAIHRVAKQCDQAHIRQNLRGAIRRGGMKNIIRRCFTGYHAKLHLEAHREMSAIPAESLQIMNIEEFDFLAKRRIDLRVPRQIIEERSRAAFHHANHEKIRQDAQRLEVALRLLTNPLHCNRRIGEIAFEAGFSDLSHFNRRFCARFHMTPSAAREEARGPTLNNG